MAPSVLIIEDEPDFAGFIIRGLSEEGYSVEHAVDGDQGWEMLRSRPWDMVLLDWSLPGQDGLAMLRRFRQSGGEAPVLFITARDEVDDRVRGLESGADDYLCKPFAFAELLARVRTQIRRRDRSPNLTLSHGDVSACLVSLRAQRAGQPLDLKAKELALLVFLLRHPGQVLSRARIYEHVWGDDFEKSSNTLEVHIMELRRKLEIRGPRLIHTIRGRGYVFGGASSAEIS